MRPCTTPVYDEDGICRHCRFASAAHGPAVLDVVALAEALWRNSRRISIDDPHVTWDAMGVEGKYPWILDASHIEALYEAIVFRGMKREKCVSAKDPDSTGTCGNCGYATEDH